MAIDLKIALTKPDAAVTFASALLQGYLTPAFGSLSKTEVDLLVFTSLIAAKAINPDGPIYDIARALNITPTRARGLVMNWQLRSIASDADLRKALVQALLKTRFSKDGTLLTFGLESPLLKEEIIARLKRKGVFADASFARELVRLPVDAFVEFLDDIVDDDTKGKVRAALVKDKQLPDRSFKALATGVLMKLGEKVAGKAGEELAGALVQGAADVVIKPATEKAMGFLTGLLTGDVAAAVDHVEAGDYAEV